MVSEVTVPVLPECDFCKDGTLAEYDAKTVLGPWANMCAPHFTYVSTGQLGTGYGQRLILAGSES